MKIAYSYKQQPSPAIWEPEKMPILTQFHNINTNHGGLTIIDQNSIIEKLRNEDKSSAAYYSCNSSYQHQSMRTNDGIKINMALKKQQKLYKIMAIKQRRSIIKDISDMPTSYNTANLSAIQIVSKVHDSTTNDFEKMCKYYALIQNENNSHSTFQKSINKCAISFNAGNSHNKSNIILTQPSLSCIKRGGVEEKRKTKEVGIIPCGKYHKHSDETDTSFSPSELVKQNFSNSGAREKLQSRSNKLEDKNQNQNESRLKIISLNGNPDYKGRTRVEGSFYREFPNNGSQGAVKKEVSQQSSSSYNRKRSIIQDSSFSESVNIEYEDKCIKRQKILESRSKQVTGCRLRSPNGNTGYNDYLMDQNQESVLMEKMFYNKNNKGHAAVSLEETSSNQQVLPNYKNQQKLQCKFEDLGTSSQEEGVNRGKQNMFYQQLQILAASKEAGLHSNTLQSSLSILEKCIYLTSTSHVHSIITNILGNFSSVSTSTPLINDSQKTITEEETIGDLMKSKELERACRANTSCSRSSVTTQPLFSSKPSSIPSISTILENSNGQESNKTEMNEISENVENNKRQHFNLTDSFKKTEEIKISESQQQIEQEEQQQLIGKIQNLLSEKREALNCSSFAIKSEEKAQNPLKNVKSQDNIVKNCKSLFRLRNLTPQQLQQFKFAQYKKKNTVGTSATNSAGCSPKNAINESVSQLASANSNLKGGSSNVSKFGKYHNYNKLFMYNVLNMFQPNNLANMDVPEVISQELQQLVSRIKTSAKNNYKVEGKYAFDYFSHAHYNILFLQLSPQNIEQLAQQDEYVSLYKACFNIDLTEEISSMTITYINLIKLYCYQIFVQCIREEDIKIDDSLTQENLKNQYTLKVIRGIKKLSQGLIIKRF